MALIDFGEEPRARRRQVPMDPVTQGVAPPPPVANYSYNGPGVSGAQTGSAQQRTQPPANPYPSQPEQPTRAQTSTNTGTVIPTYDYAPDVTRLYQQHFYRAPEAWELSGWRSALSGGKSTLANLDAELRREAARLGLTAPTATTTPAASEPAAYARSAANQPTGVDSAKWLSGHSSPKYVWKEATSLFNQKTPEGRAQALAYAQQKLPDAFNGWIIDGDKLRYTGNNLHSSFDGYNEFDAWRGSKAGEWAGSWQPTQRNGQAYLAPTTSGQPGAGGGQGAGGGMSNGSPLPSGFDPFGPTNPASLGALQFDDPDTKRLLEFVNERVKTLSSGVEDPSVSRALEAIYGRADDLSTPQGPTEQGQRYEDMVASAIDRLMQPAMDESSTAMYRTQMLDRMEKDRQGEIRAATRQLMQAGHGPESGTIQQAIQDINTRYGQQRTVADRDLALFGIEETQRRQGEALNLATESRDFSLDERENQDQRLQQALSLILQAPGITRQARGEQQANLDKALSLLSLPVDLTDRRMQQALQVLGLGGGSNPMGIFNSLANLSAQTAAQAGQNQASDSAFWSQLGSLIASAAKDGE